MRGRSARGRNIGGHRCLDVNFPILYLHEFASYNDQRCRWKTWTPLLDCELALHSTAETAAMTTACFIGNDAIDLRALTDWHSMDRNK
jgi:hypothetical protein